MVDTKKVLETYLSALSKLKTDEERKALGALLKKIGEVSVKCLVLIEEMDEKYPGLRTGIINERDYNSPELRDMVTEYNVNCDLEETLIGMLPDEELKNLFGHPVKIEL